MMAECDVRLNRDGDAQMKYILMDYVNEAGWPQLTRAEQQPWLGACKAFMEAMTDAGVLKHSSEVRPTPPAAMVRIADENTQVLDGPYADSKEQLVASILLRCSSRRSKYEESNGLQQCEPGWLLCGCERRHELGS